MAPRLQDESMRAYDAANVPGLRRPRSMDAKVARLVAESGERASARLVKLIAMEPESAVMTVRIIRKHLSDVTQNPEPKLLLLDQLMRNCPYFYRFTANPRFFSTMWALHKAQTVSPSARMLVLILIRAWAEDLAAMFFRRNDPPAAFWVERYDRKRRYIKFPELPSGEDRPFVCRVSAANKRIPLERGHIMNREELDASLLLLERLLAAAEEDPQDWQSVAVPVHQLASSVRRSIPHLNGYANYENEGCSGPLSDDPSATVKLQKKPAGKENAPRGACALNEKVMAILRRYDEAFARFDPYLSSPHSSSQRLKIRCPDVFGELEEFPTYQASMSSGSTGPSVAAVAREKARWKLSLTASSSTLASATDHSRAEEALRNANLEDDEAEQNSTDALSFPAVTPATFAKYAFGSTQTSDDVTKLDGPTRDRKGASRRSAKSGNSSRSRAERRGSRSSSPASDDLNCRNIVCAAGV